ncbi:MAG: hypothetical protein IRY99_10270 [Isosphaeraceae bacterium]|nr:hypothetical protein [Isosphaeraceae bacterium]
MPPPSNEAQGLKIAVAVFVTLTVILGVTTYFGFSNYATAEAQREDAVKQKNAALNEATKARQELTELKQIAGYEKIEEFPQLKDAIAKDSAKLRERINQINKEVSDMVAAYQQAGGNDKKIVELQSAANQIVAQYSAETFQSFQTLLNRMAELLANQAQLATAMALDNEALRRDLANANKTYDERLQVEVGEKQKAKEDLNQEHTQHETERQNLLAKVEQLQNLNNEQATRIQAMENEMAQMRAQFNKDMADQLRLVQNFRRQVEKKETILERPAGRITYVDYGRNEVHTTLTRGQGAREQLVLTVFDRNAPGLPTDKPKATIELIQVGERGSIARILKTITTSDPIRVRDFVYSPAFDPTEPRRFALIGKMDMDRDGRDDREDLKRLIRQSGGIVEYDLPPAGVGREAGTPSGLISWYVIDERPPLRTPTDTTAVPTEADEAFERRKAEVLQKLDAAGVRPMTLDRLLTYLNWQYGGAVSGRVESINRERIDALLKPKGRTGVSPPPADGTPPAVERPEGELNQEENPR